MVPGSIPGGRTFVHARMAMPGSEKKQKCWRKAPTLKGKDAHAGSRTRVTSMGGLYDAATLHALKIH